MKQWAVRLIKKSLMWKTHLNFNIRRWKSTKTFTNGKRLVSKTLWINDCSSLGSSKLHYLEWCYLNLFFLDPVAKRCNRQEWTEILLIQYEFAFQRILFFFFQHGHTLQTLYQYSFSQLTWDPDLQFKKILKRRWCFQLGERDSKKSSQRFMFVPIKVVVTMVKRYG